MNKVQAQGSVDVYPSDFFMPLSQEEADFLMSWVPPQSRRPIRPIAIEAYNLRVNGVTYAELGRRYGITGEAVKRRIYKVVRRRFLARREGAGREQG